jgi:spermidine synthase
LSLVGLLVFGSGFCALVLQTGWVREFRLIFGASTAASAAVVAIFIGGLGAGGLLLGRRADRHSRPLALYAQLEGIVGLSAAASPWLLSLVRTVYIAVGGTPRLGATAGTALRLMLSALVLAIPTMAMGGTLAAAASALVRHEALDHESERHHVALLYGLNTLGAVTGCVAATFALLELLGTRRTMWLASGVNLVIAIAAYHASSSDSSSSWSRRLRQSTRSSQALKVQVTREAPTIGEPQTAVVFILLASGIAGFVFFLMELVWSRMLGPLLGGTVFTFGLVLAIALAGMGLGALCYASIGGEKPATLSALAWTCVVEGLALAVPFALGDRLAILALMLRPLSGVGFAGHIATWTILTMPVVFPASVAAGYQFPLLIALVGRGRQRLERFDRPRPAGLPPSLKLRRTAEALAEAGRSRASRQRKVAALGDPTATDERAWASDGRARGTLGREIGAVYASNTVGAILGSLAGGFGLLPWLSAPGAWRLAAISLVALGTTAATLGWFRSERRAIVGPMMVSVAVVACLFATGPTAVWRHSGIGAGRAQVDATAPNALREWSQAQKRGIVWAEDGVESSVALAVEPSGYTVIVNGKADGGTRTDAATQVMFGLLGALLNPGVRRSLVVGLGTGTTAGWLGAIPTMERVDVVELEPLVVDVARACDEVNRDVLRNPKVQIAIGDARETLLAGRERYDLIASEPSNPFRAGIASLFTQEYYEAARGRLTEHGVFLQWVQLYEVDARTLHSVYATISSVFPHVEAWEAGSGDLVLVASMRPLTYSAADLAARLHEEPFMSALNVAWRAADLPALLAHLVANERLAPVIKALPGVAINTDDRNLVEFGFARSVGSPQSAPLDLRPIARSVGAARPSFVDEQTGEGTGGGTIDWSAVDTAWIAFRVAEQHIAIPAERFLVDRPPDTQSRRTALTRYYRDSDLAAARAAWREYPRSPIGPTELAMVADLEAETGSDEALDVIDRLRAYQPGEAAVILATLRFRQARFDESAGALALAFEYFHTSPWTLTRFAQRGVALAGAVALQSPQLANRMFDALGRPFAIRALDDERLMVRAMLSRRVSFAASCQDALAPLEPHVPWDRGLLTLRRDCYQATRDPRQTTAARDLEELLAVAAASDPHDGHESTKSRKK